MEGPELERVEGHRVHRRQKEVGHKREAERLNHGMPMRACVRDMPDELALALTGARHSFERFRPDFGANVPTPWEQAENIQDLGDSRASVATAAALPFLGHVLLS
ncbi:MAG TPA: hypothetical protein VL997_16510 [Dyella sp.]|nr:hypothetical protein [Dyella sp.]